MRPILVTLLFVAPEWVRDYITPREAADVFWSEYVVWPLIQIVIVLFIILTLVAYLFISSAKYRRSCRRGSGRCV